MMYRKAVLFNDIECSHKILDAKNPGAAKALGRAVKKFDQEIWNDNCFDIVVEANILKFSQNQAIRDFLISTKKRVLVEASPTLYPQISEREY